MAHTLKHFTHSHILTKKNFSDEFLCDGCNMLGSGIRYHCSGCKFDLHEDCATCPEKLETYIHPGHKLTRVWEGLQSSTNGLSRPCNICGDQVKGLFYRCSEKVHQHSFFLHPLCSKFPSQVNHVIHNHHHLKFQSVPFIPNSRCSICGNIVSASSWSYRCDPCGVNIHLECVTLPYDHQEKRPVPPPGSNLGGSSAAVAPLPYYNQPPNYNYGYEVPYGYPPPPSTSSGGRKRKMFAIVCQIMTTAILGAALGVYG
ncbi:hypothetical protein MKW98_020989 [Papaver atlanticum]|uniref:Phorbol-ester/DAG-type domain-containing protein n=1 Tax=Papaver atlanticum TaxID=357466 RepID=A0AAD4SKV8_9MAGN|nr:hypothetical protein MKW98_020989 [Papaver atlanticum]